MKLFYILSNWTQNKIKQYLMQFKIKGFQQKIYNFYQQNKRKFAWRENITPYKILVSEIMLQQTQTIRVVPKFDQWMLKFPDFETLAKASTHQVLVAWQGLGYNRRGLALHKIAQQIMYDFNGVLPADIKVLQTFAGIGPNTAGSICAFAFNQAVIFIETNIRTVFLHEFFIKQKNISDKQLLPLLQACLDKKNSREWYYALMDYGVYLKKELKINNKNSKHYIPQSKFIGSKRQVRGAIVRFLTQYKKLNHEDLILLVKQDLMYNHHDVLLVVQQLVRERLVQQDQKHYFL